MIPTHVRENFTTPPGWTVSADDSITTYTYHNTYTPAPAAPNTLTQPTGTSLFNQDSATMGFTVETHQGEHYLPYTYLHELDDIPQTVDSRTEFERYAQRIADILHKALLNNTYTELLDKHNIDDPNITQQYATYFEFLTALAQNPTEFPSITPETTAELLTTPSGDKPDHLSQAILMMCPNCQLNWWQLHNTDTINEFLALPHLHCPLCRETTFTLQNLGPNANTTNFETSTSITTPHTIAPYSTD